MFLKHFLPFLQQIPFFKLIQLPLLFILPLRFYSYSLHNPSSSHLTALYLFLTNLVDFSSFHLQLIRSSTIQSQQKVYNNHLYEHFSYRRWKKRLRKMFNHFIWCTFCFPLVWFLSAASALVVIFFDIHNYDYVHFALFTRICRHSFSLYSRHTIFLNAWSKSSKLDNIFSAQQWLQLSRFFCTICHSQIKMRKTCDGNH